MEIARHWRLKAQRYRLEGSICLSCGRLIFPPRPICPNCITQAVRIAGYQFSVIPPPNRINHFVPSERMIV